MIGARSSRIAGPAARANSAANSGPRRSSIGSSMIPPSAAAAASRRAEVVRPAADHSNPIAPTAPPPSAATAHRTSWPRSRSARATGATACTCPAPPVLVHSTRSGRCIAPSNTVTEPKEDDRTRPFRGRSDAVSEVRPCAQSRRARIVQRDGRALHRAGRSRPLGRALLVLDGNVIVTSPSRRRPAVHALLAEHVPEPPRQIELAAGGR